MFHGGLTPTVGELMTAKKHTNIKILTMIRPREGGFCYTDAEFETAQADAEILLANGSDGIVCGFLNSDGTVNEKRCAELKIIADKYNKEIVFHRAFDVVPNWKYAMDSLAAMGFNRILTSGQMPNVFEATDTIKDMIEYANGRIEILPGAGITLQNAVKFVNLTGCKQIHLARHKVCYDLSVTNNNDIFYGGALYPPEDRYSVIDKDYISKVCADVKG